MTSPRPKAPQSPPLAQPVRKKKAPAKAPAASQPQKSAPQKSILPRTLSPEVKKIASQISKGQDIEKGFRWILDKADQDNPILELAGEFVHRYQQQIQEKAGPHGKQNGPLLRAVLLQRCIQTLPYFRLRFADKAFNPLFLRTWFQKQLLATILGITERDVDLKIRHSGKTPIQYLDAALQKTLSSPPFDQLK